MHHSLSHLTYTLANIYEQLKIPNRSGNPTLSFGDEMDSAKLYYYLVASMPFINSFKSYLPKQELAVLFTMIKLPSMQDYHINVYGYSSGLLGQTLHLIELHIQRRPDSAPELLDKLHDAIQDIPQRLLSTWIKENINLKNSQSTAVLLRKAGLAEEKLIGTEDGMFQRREMLEIIPNCISNEKQEQDKTRALVTAVFEASTETLDERISELLLNIMNAYFHNDYSQHNPFHKTFDDRTPRVRAILNTAIKTLGNLSINKEKFYRETLTIHRIIYEFKGATYNLYAKSYLLDYLAIFSENIPLSELIRFVENERFEPPDTGFCAVLKPSWRGNCDKLYPALGTYGLGYIRVFDKDVQKNGLYYVDKWTGYVKKLNIDFDELIRLDEKQFFPEIAYRLNDEQLAEIKSLTIAEDKSKPGSPFDSSSYIETIWQKLTEELALMFSYGQLTTGHEPYCRGHVAQPTSYLTILANDVSLTLDTCYMVEDDMPLLIQLLPAKNHDALKELYAATRRINLKAADVHQINVDKFFMFKQPVISNYISLMSLDGIAQLRQQIAGTVLSLVRFCENLPILPPAMLEELTSYYRIHQSLIKHNPVEDNAWYTVLTIIHTLLTTYANKADIFIQTLLHLSNNCKPSDYSNALAGVLFEDFLHKMNLGKALGKLINLDEINAEAVFERIPHDKFTQLVKAYSAMKESPYKSVFLHLFKLDLTGESVDQFLHEINQENPLGKSLAQHNQAIHDKLTSKNIDPGSALNYQKKMEYIIPPNSDYSPNHTNELAILWDDTRKLKDEVINERVRHNKENTLLTNQFTAILNSIHTLEELIHKNNIPDNLHQSHIIASVLATTENMALLDKIERNLTALRTNRERFLIQFNQCSDHFSEQYSTCKNIKEKATAVIKLHPFSHYFRIEQWSKEHPMTFFLGDAVGCCLSTDGAKFPAMVQRRLDDAMLFHVAIDQITDKPAALIWLYLAETAQGSVSLVANFFEVNAKYATNNRLRLSLLQNLLLFTHQYCLDNPNIDGFYMNPLTYGWNIKDLEPYPLETLDIADKLGGPFVPGKVVKTKELYYLASLCNESKQFHRFNSDILKNTLIPGMYHLAAMIDTWVDELMPQSLEHIQREIIQTHPFELTPFFSIPFEKNEKLMSIIKSTYEQKQLSRVNAAVFLRKQGFLAKLSAKNEPINHEVMPDQDLKDSAHGTNYYYL